MAQNMKKFYCDTFQITVEFKEKDLKKEELFEEIGIVEDDVDTESQGLLFAIFNSKYKTKKEHAHVMFRFNGDDSELRIGFHPGAGETDDDDDDGTRYVEDLGNWLSKYFVNDILDADIMGLFEFGEKFKPGVRLNYPLLIDNTMLHEAKVVGYDLEFSDDAFISRANLSQIGDRCLVLLLGNVELNLPKFKYLAEIKRFNKYANAFVIKKEEM